MVHEEEYDMQLFFSAKNNNNKDQNVVNDRVLSSVRDSAAPTNGLFQYYIRSGALLCVFLGNYFIGVYPMH